MASVTFPVALGGDGKTYTDDADPDTGLDGLGYITRLVPLFKNGLAMTAYTAQYAAKIDAAAANADRAEDAKRYVEAVAEAYKVNLLDAYRDRITLGADFKAGRYTRDDGARLDTGVASDVFTTTGTAPIWTQGPGGNLVVSPAGVVREWRSGKPEGLLITGSYQNLIPNPNSRVNLGSKLRLVSESVSRIDSFGEEKSLTRVYSSETGESYMFQTLGEVTTGGAWTFAIDAVADGLDTLIFAVRGVDGIFYYGCKVNIVNGEVYPDVGLLNIQTPSNGVNVEVLADGVVRISFSHVYEEGGVAARLLIGLGDGGATSTPADPSSGVILSGLSLYRELGVMPPNQDVGAPVTVSGRRVYADLERTDQGTVFLEFNNRFSSGSAAFIASIGLSSNNYIGIGYSVGSLQIGSIFFVVDGVNYAGVLPESMRAGYNERCKMCVSWSAGGDLIVSVNGQSVIMGTLPDDLSQIEPHFELGGRGSVFRVKRCNYYQAFSLPYPVSQSVMQELTAL
ncbi:hypothetical protein LG409_02585 [Halomonas sp. NyZ770]|uniref:hypothetical protein n=1 Tax=Halomonas sp. NyZ770 TaxID=2883106 RepID=UPI001D0ABFE0|nr:hypothetical protein [Halomonas sp. NyZ770]UDM07808.1 hypothetical protein LG409_02585 [Halomonas sp. NyZ770]